MYWLSLFFFAQVFGNASNPSLDKTAPSVTISTPTSSSTYDAGTSATVTLAGTSSDASGIAICRYTNSLGGSGNAATSSDGSWSIANAALTVGDNVITVTCVDPGNNQGTDVLTVTRSSASSCARTIVWLDTNAYEKPCDVSITMPTATVHYYVNIQSGSDSSGCGTTSSPCATLRGLTRVGGGGTTFRNLTGIRCVSTDAIADINIGSATSSATSGSTAFFLFNEPGCFGGTVGKEVVIKPWGTGLVTFNRGGTAQGIVGGSTMIRDLIIYGDDGTGNRKFKFVADNTGSNAFSLKIVGDRITLARVLCTATVSSGNPRCFSYCGDDGEVCTGFSYINNEVYDCNGGSGEQCGALYVGSCLDTGGCNAHTILIQNSVARNLGGECYEMNPRTQSENFIIDGNVMYDCGHTTEQSSMWSARPCLSFNINQSGTLDDVIVRNNLMWDCSSGCIWEQTQSTSTHTPKIYNNTCIGYGTGTSNNSRPEGISQQGFTSNARIQNNIIWSSTGVNPFGSSGQSYDAWSNNGIGSGETGGTSNQAVSAATFQSTTVNNANYLKPTTGAAVVNAGTSLSADVPVDYLDATRPVGAAFDIGAFEVN